MDERTIKLVHGTLSDYVGAVRGVKGAEIPHEKDLLYAIEWAAALFEYVSHDEELKKKLGAPYDRRNKQTG